MENTSKFPKQDAIERVILRRLHENRIDGYTLEMAHEIAALVTQAAPSELTPVWYQNLCGFIKGIFPADERWKAIFLEQLDLQRGRLGLKASSSDEE